LQSHIDDLSAYADSTFATKTYSDSTYETKARVSNLEASLIAAMQQEIADKEALQSSYVNANGRIDNLSSLINSITGVDEVLYVTYC
jgi:hypothetical protein